MSATAATTRTFTIDKAHSEAIFQVRHLVTKVRGRFTDLGGTVHVRRGRSPSGRRSTFTIQAASIDTGTPDRDAHLRSEDFFDVEKYPTITFTSTGIKPSAGTSYEVTGDLTIRGVTKRIETAGDLPGQGQGSLGEREARLRDRDDAQPQGLRPDVERGARNGRIPRRRRGENRGVDSGAPAE